MIEPIVTPTLESKPAILADWLELIAYFNEFNVASLDALWSAIAQQHDEHESDFGELDRIVDQFNDDIENEIRERLNSCGKAYPFFLSDDGEELIFNGESDPIDSVPYLVCLFATHIGSDSLFDQELTDDTKSRLRNRVFQVICTLAMAGHEEGSAVSVGWPRANQETILNALRRASSWGAGFVARDKPGMHASPHGKDGGIDIIAWRKVDRPPPTSFAYAQVASGKNWQEKPVGTYIQTFESAYMDNPPHTQRTCYTLIPFRIDDTIIWQNEHLRHGAIFDRTRLPIFSNQGYALAQKGVEMDEFSNFQQTVDWVQTFQDRSAFD